MDNDRKAQLLAELMLDMKAASFIVEQVIVVWSNGEEFTFFLNDVGDLTWKINYND